MSINYKVFKEADSYSICFLVNSIKEDAIRREYLQDLNLDDVLLVEIPKDPERKKLSAKTIKEFYSSIAERLHDLQVQYLVICHSDFYKVITKETKVEVNLGYIKEIDDFKVIYVPDFKSIFYDPIKVRDKISRSLQALKDSLQGHYVPPGTLTFNAQYPSTEQEIFDALKDYLNEPVLTCDIETYSLRPHLAGIASIGFSPDIHRGIAFAVDMDFENPNQVVRQYLKDFFMQYQGKLIFHNISFDSTVLIYQLFMKDIADTEGLLEGLGYLLKNFEDTKLIAYLATNSCAGNELGLKALAQEFAGNYAQEEIGDVSKIPLDQLLRYNLVDCLSTWYVYNKYRPIMERDQQEDIYNNLFLPTTRDIVQMQLTGFPLNMSRVEEVEKLLLEDQNQALDAMNQSPIIQNFVDILKQEWVEEKNAKLKKKRVTLEDATSVVFNPRSRVQLNKLFYEELNLPIINKTDKGSPSTDANTLEALKHRTSDSEIHKILQALIDFIAVDKILSAFIPSFKEAVYSEQDHWHYLIGSFNLGGTVSGRLSSSKPNLQQIPATGSKYAKLIKSCFQAPQGWLLCGLDFNALEAHIDALVTKDPAKLAVYISDYDSHMYNAYHYWRDQCPEIELLQEDYQGKCYKVTIDGNDYLLKEGDKVELPDGSITTIEKAIKVLNAET